MKTILFLGDCLDMGGIGRAFTTLVNAIEDKSLQVRVVALYKEDIDRMLPAARERLVGYVWRYRITNRLIGKIARLINWVTYWKLYFFFAKKFEHDAFVVYAANIDPQWCWYSDKPCFGWLHGETIIGFHKMPSLLRRMIKCRIGRAYAKYKGIIAVSSATAEYWRNLIVLPSLPQVMQNIYNVEEIIKASREPQSEILCSGDVPRLLTVARLSAEKGIRRLIETYARLMKDGFKFNAYIVGGGPGEDEYAKMISNSGLTGIVHLLGEKKNPYPYMAASDLLVCSSFSEGLSVVLGEALILGCSVLSTNCGGHQAFLQDGKWGRVVENSHEGLYNGLKEYLQDCRTAMPRIPFNEIRAAMRQRDIDSADQVRNMLLSL